MTTILFRCILRSVIRTSVPGFLVHSARVAMVLFVDTIVNVRSRVLEPTNPEIVRVEPGARSLPRETDAMIVFRTDASGVI